jgi:putative transcriptional regulator
MRKRNTSGKTPKPRTASQVLPAAVSDPDAQALTAADFQRRERTPQTKVIRMALALPNKEFASRYRIPLGTRRDWEQGCARPDQPTRAYFVVIACNLRVVQRALRQG